MNPNGTNEQQDEWGKPVDELRDLELPPSPRFLLGVANKIDRRRTTAQLASFSWTLPKVILMEMVAWLSQLETLFGSKKQR